MPGFVAGVQELVDGEWVIYVETDRRSTGCPACGVVARSHGRRRVAVRDLPVAGRPVVLLWSKRIWRCAGADCDTKTWTETSEYITPRAVLTERAQAEICRRVGAEEDSVAALAREFGVSWAAAMAAVRHYGAPLIDDPARREGVGALGVDETTFLHARPGRRTVSVTGFVDLDRARLLDVVPGRSAAAAGKWLAERDQEWRDAISVAALDAFRGYNTALSPTSPTPQWSWTTYAALLRRVRDRIGDKRVVRLVKAFLRAGVVSEAGIRRDTNTGTPQGGILSPLLANIALSVLDEHFAKAWKANMATRVDRARLHRHGQPTYRLVRYADDFVVMVSGTKAHAEGLKDEVAEVLSTKGLRLSQEKTMIVHIDEGFVFLGFRIQRKRKRGTKKAFVYTWPSKKALASIKAKVKTISRQGLNNTLSDLLRRMNQMLRGWTNYFRHGVSKATFGYLRKFSWSRVIQWLRAKHRRANWKYLRRRYLDNRWWPEHDGVVNIPPLTGHGSTLPGC
jgi:hypothetical protein